MHGVQGISRRLEFRYSLAFLKLSLNEKILSILKNIIPRPRDPWTLFKLENVSPFCTSAALTPNSASLSSHFRLYQIDVECSSP